MDGRTLPTHFALFCAALSLAGANVTADVATLGASKDNSIFENNVNNSLGAGQAIFSGTNGQGAVRRGLIQFEVASSIPAGSTIESVQLKLYLNQVSGAAGSSPTIRLFRIAGDWGEGTAGSTSNGTSGVGQGFAAGEGDATWNARHYSATSPTLWNSQGGDFASTDSAALAIVGSTLNAPYFWGSTPAMVGDVQNWLDNPAGNFGWLLKNDNETNLSTLRGFWTREAARTGQGAFAPQLLVTFTPIPEPAATALLVGSVLLSILRRRA
jgi:hypothetical protein